MEFAGKTVIVTGAGQGIGRALAHAFATRGGRVLVADLNATAGQRVVEEIAAAGGEALLAVVDVADPEQVEAMARTALSGWGRIDVLINNAALFSTLTLKPFDEIPLAEWDRMFDVNAKGVFLCARAVAPSMRAQGAGKIVNMTSVVVDTGRAGYAHYVASKAAVLGLTRALATELGPHGVNVNAISPHGIATEVPRETISEDQWAGVIASQAIRRKGAPMDVVGAALFLASDGSGFITGQNLGVNAGAHCN